MIYLIKAFFHKMVYKMNKKISSILLILMTITIVFTFIYLFYLKEKDNKEILIAKNVNEASTLIVVR